MSAQTKRVSSISCCLISNLDRFNSGAAFPRSIIPYVMTSMSTDFTNAPDFNSTIIRMVLLKIMLLLANKYKNLPFGEHPLIAYDLTFSYRHSSVAKLANPSNNANAARAESVSCVLITLHTLHHHNAFGTNTTKHAHQSVQFHFVNFTIRFIFFAVPRDRPTDRPPSIRFRPHAAPHAQRHKSLRFDS